jgi:hypothetical protein
MEHIFYNGRMKTDIELKTGNWLLVVGSRSIVPTLLKMTARLAETGPVRVVDCGNVYDAYLAGSGTRGGDPSTPHGIEAADPQGSSANGGRKPPLLEVLKRIQVSNVYNCHEVLATLESMASEPVPFVVLDLLKTFCYTSVAVDERKRILRLCLAQLNRLKRGAEGLVSVHPPRILCQAESDLLEMVTRAAKDTYHVEMALPVFSFSGRI